MARTKNQRARNVDGQIREKRGDTLIKSIERNYSVDFGVRGDMKLETYLKNEGLPSLAKALDRFTKAS